MFPWGLVFRWFCVHVCFIRKFLGLIDEGGGWA